MRALGVDPPHGAPLFLLLAMIYVASLPDAMLPPVLRDLLVSRYSVTPAAAHWFMAINLVGAMAAVPILAMLRGRASPALLIGVGALCNGALLLGLALPIGFGWSVSVRFLEGAADMVVLAVLFNLLSSDGPRAWRGHRLGLGGTALMLGLATGAISGGRLGEAGAASVLIAGAVASGVLAVIAFFGIRLLRRCERAPRSEAIRVATGTLIPLWPSLAMFGSDRALAGLLSTTVPLLLGTLSGWNTSSIGMMIGVPMAVMALGSWPAGVLADRFGALRVRTIAALMYAAGIAAIPLLVEKPGWLLMSMMLIIGVAASALMPSALALAARTERGSTAMGACQAAGNVGFLLGVAGAGALLSLLGGTQPSILAYTMTVHILALLHVAITGIGLSRLADVL